MQMSWRPETKLKSVIQAPNIEIFEYLSRHPPSPPRPPPNSPSIELFVSSKRKKSFKADDDDSLGGGREEGGGRREEGVSVRKINGQRCHNCNCYCC